MIYTMHIAHNFPCFINQLLRSLDCRGQSSVDGARSSCCWRFRWRTWHHGWWQSFHGIRGLRCRSCAVRSNLPSIHPSIHPCIHPLIVWLVDRPSIQGFEELLGRVGAAEAATAEALKALAAFAAEAGTKGLKRRPNGKGAMNLKILTHLQEELVVE